MEVPTNPDINLYDQVIRRETNIVAANEQLAHHFTEVAAEHRERLNGLLAERNALLGRLALGNVVALPADNNLGDIA